MLKLIEFFLFKIELLFKYYWLSLTILKELLIPFSGQLKLLLKELLNRAFEFFSDPIYKPLLATGNMLLEYSLNNYKEFTKEFGKSFKS